MTPGLPRAIAVVPDGEPALTVTLGHEARHRRRVRLAADEGPELLLDLPEARRLRDGDRLVLEDGRRVLVRAAPEPVLEVRAGNPAALSRLAWHLGNRHALVQVLDGGALRLRDDHVLATMLVGLGAELARTTAPFDPEIGAYAAGHAHGHGRGDG